MKVLRDDVVRLCEALGFKAAAQWKRQKMQDMLRKIAGTEDVRDTDVEGNDLQTLLHEIVALKGDVEVVRTSEELGGPSAPVAPEPTVEPEAEAVPELESKTEPEEVQGDVESANSEESCEGEQEPAAEQKAEAKPKKRGRKPKVEGKPKAEQKAEANPQRGKLSKKKGKSGPSLGDGKLEGISSIRNRLFCAGVTVKRNGLEAGVTDQLVNEVDKLTGIPNLKASHSQLVLAWHAINGYVHGE